ncbi:hypothetical protein psal_cds_625 [Pandoravirus salinus]|uniref:Uncharacterized protein n=1 Tax=Pandoravirus salinus TaxID=1349410 RepID=S4VYI8_9VIRU|nr:hypothetical protein psal_cds_625 [Pandoravirus salinus]AGO84511.1 hypothetical protein psal_cds_625 [Pandoravirus salinus]
MNGRHSTETNLETIGVDRKPVVLSRDQLVAFFARRYPTDNLFYRDNPLMAHGICDAPAYMVQWYSTRWCHNEPRPRIVTPLDADGLAHGSERYFYEGLTSEGGIRFCHGVGVEITKMPFRDSLCSNAMPLSHLDQINRAPESDKRTRREPYRDRCRLGRRAVCRFLLASASDGMRSLPWELRDVILAYILPLELRNHRKAHGYPMLPDGFAATSWLAGV